MSIFNGDNIKIQILGSSHGEYVGVKLFNFPHKKIDFDKVNTFLQRRKPNFGKITTSRQETDLPIIVSGITDNTICSNVVQINFANQNINRQDYTSLYAKPRPSHADYSAYLLDGRLDFGGGGEFSGRMTVGICLAGAICAQLLSGLGIVVKGYISRIGDILGLSYNDFNNQLDLLNLLQENAPALSNWDKMEQLINKAVSLGDSVGGQIEVIALNVAGGVGGNLFGGLESKVSSLMFSIPGVKGVESGLGVNFSQSYGSNSNDAFYIKNGIIKTKTNNCGGILGGITNGMPITFRVSFKPTPSISLPQDTVDLVKRQNVQIKINGRHDGCFVVRAIPIVESCLNIALVDALYKELND